MSSQPDPVACVYGRVGGSTTNYETLADISGVAQDIISLTDVTHGLCTSAFGYCNHMQHKTFTTSSSTLQRYIYIFFFQ